MPSQLWWTWAGPSFVQMLLYNKFSLPSPIESASVTLSHLVIRMILEIDWASLVAQKVKNLPAMQETWVWSLGWEDPLGRSPWKIPGNPWRRAWQPTPVFLPGESPWTEEPSRPHSMGLQRVRCDWVTDISHCVYGMEIKMNTISNLDGAKNALFNF